MAKAITDLAGQRFGKLTVLCLAGTKYKGRVQWLCRCDCGTEVVKQLGNVKRSVACRKCNIEAMRIRATTHGKSNMPEYNIWHAMIERCTFPNDKRFMDYGGRGIKVCERWAGPEGAIHFIEDMGPRPSPKYSLDRINVNGNYEPKNCRWATAKEQRANQRAKMIHQFSNEEILSETLKRKLILWPEKIN